MSHQSSNEISHTSEAIAHHNPYKEYFTVFAALMVLVVVTVAAARLPIPEPFSFLIALTIAVIKAVLVILFFMHVKDASRITWVFCVSAFLWLVIMLALTFADYMSRISVGGNTSAAYSGTVATSPAPVNPESSHQ